MNWTSVLRTKAGHSFYERTDEWVSAFTIDNESDRFAQMLLRLGYQKASRWKRRTRFHIDVVTTEGGLDETEFYLNAEQLKKVRTLTVIGAISPSRIVVNISSINQVG